MWFLVKIAGNGKRLCDVRAFTPKSSIKNCTKQKSFPLPKLQKKWKRKLFFATKNDETFNARAFNPAYCKTDVLVAQLKYTNKLV